MILNLIEKGLTIMKTIGLLKNTIQEYAWGSYTAVAELLGQKSPSDTPQAELWMGAHPKAPSMVNCSGQWVSLLELIEQNPENILGKAIAQKFNNRLPYLFKVLAAAKPLSIQAHPSQTQARKGFARENNLGIPLNAPNRNYKDDNHKPECICALTDFWALNGFRKISELLFLMEQIRPLELADELEYLRNHQNTKGLHHFFHALMTMAAPRKKKIVQSALASAQRLSSKDPIFQWMIKLHNDYPDDIGILSPIILNLVLLEPGQALFLSSGELHAYLDGVGIEIMANSDNVLRGGLTPKHIDVDELLNVLNFEERDIQILSKKKVNDCEDRYACPAEEFVLSMVSVNPTKVYQSPVNRSVEIVLCTQGKAVIRDPDNETALSVVKGDSLIIPAAVRTYGIEGTAVFYKAAVPI